MNARLLTLTVSALALLMGCEGSRAPTAPTVPVDPSRIISDGAHGGNKDFFFLPPMVPLPLRNPDFELGKFNNTLRPSLRIEICELNADHLKTGGLPSDLTTCGAVKKTFAPGTVNVVNLPLRQNGWWTLFGLPADGFYYALWDTRQSNLSVSKYYRVKVFIDGNSTPLGVADVDPMSNLSQWKYSLTGEVIQLVDDVMLPITFRVEKGGGSALCGTATVCGSATITNNSTTGSQIVTVDGGAGAVAGVQFPNGWLPPTGPQSVVVTVAKVDLGSTNPTTGAETTPCHAGLPLQQFPGCFRFTTTPALATDESGRQFARPVIAAVCYTLYGTGDPREKFAEMYASGPNEPPHALEDASDVGILSAATRNCSTSTEVIGATGGNALTRFATNGWRRMKSGAGQLFGVKTAYGIDLGLGGFMSAFSNVGPALAATIQPVGSTTINLTSGGTIQPFVRIVGSNHHDGQHQNTIGIGGLPVTFTVTAGNALLSQQGEEGGTATQLVATTNTLPIDIEGITAGGGYATVNCAIPNVAGDYTVTASGPALGGPITFHINVTPPPPNSIALTTGERRMLSMQTGASISLIPSLEDTVNEWTSSDPTKVSVSSVGLVTALVGGENINGGDAVSITSVAGSNEHAGPNFLVNSFGFDIFPRTTTLAWNPVAGATSYDVSVEFGNGSADNPFCAPSPATCGIWTPQSGSPFHTSASQTTVSFVGAQPGRWQVIARNAAGAVLNTSSYVYFSYAL